MATVKTIKSKSKKSGKAAKAKYNARKKGISAARERRDYLKSIELPTGPKERELDLNRYSWLIYGVPKIGKTTFLSSFPEALFLTTEPGTKGMLVHEFNSDGGGVIDWEHFLRAVDLLEETDDYKCVIIDTANNLFEFCCDYFIEKLGIEEMGLTEDGEKDWGVSYRMVKRALNKAITRIRNTGRGVHFTTHAAETVVKKRTGGEAPRIDTTLSKSAKDVIMPVVDHIWYCEYMKVDGKDTRIIITEGDEMVNAGTREMTEHEIPKFLPLMKRGGFDMIEEAAAGDDVGLDPLELMTSEKSNKKKETLDKLVAREKGKAIRKKRRGKKKIKVKRR